MWVRSDSELSLVALTLLIQIATPNLSTSTMLLKRSLLSLETDALLVVIK
jgi:hypothetical protein